MKRTAFHFKVYKLALPRVRLRNGFTAPKDYILVRVHDNIAFPWSHIRPMVLCAATHVKKEAVRVWRTGYVVNTTPHVLEISSGDRWRGMAHGARAEVFIGSVNSAWYPKQARYRRFKDMPEYWYRDWVEQLVGLTAHELWHRWDGLDPGRKAEFDAELVTMDAISAWRRKLKYVYTGPEAAIIPQSTCNGETSCNLQTVNK